MTNHTTTLLERITAVLERARIDGGWDDETVARAVLQEMREPTGAMKDAGAETYGIGNGAIGAQFSVLAGQPTKAYRAMIDAALSEQPDAE